MPAWMILVLLALATHRVTRVIVRDEFPPAKALRVWVDKRFGEAHWLAYLSTCEWCASVWVSAALTGGLAAVRPGWLAWPAWVLAWLSAASVAGLIAQREPD